jgi:hypothetical protein
MEPLREENESQHVVDVHSIHVVIPRIAYGYRNGYPRILIVEMACTVPPTIEIRCLLREHPGQEDFEKTMTVPIEDHDGNNLL